MKSIYNVGIISHNDDFLCDVCQEVIKKGWNLIVIKGKDIKELLAGQRRLNFDILMIDYMLTHDIYMAGIIKEFTYLCRKYNVPIYILSDFFCPANVDTNYELLNNGTWIEVDGFFTVNTKVKSLVGELERIFRKT